MINKSPETKPLMFLAWKEEEPEGSCLPATPKSAKKTAKKSIVNGVIPSLVRFFFFLF